MSRIIPNYDRLNDLERSKISHESVDSQAVVAARFGRSHVAFITEGDLPRFAGRTPSTMTLWTADRESITSILRTFAGTSHISCDAFTAVSLDRILLESVRVPTISIIGPSLVPFWYEDPIAFQKLDPFIAIWSREKQETFISYQPISDLKNIPATVSVYTRPFRT